MTLDEAMAALEAAGTEQARKIYRRHGVADPMFGVSYAELGRLKKAIKRDQRLAADLWATEVHDARILATMVAEPSAFDAPLVGAWAESAADHAVLDAFAKDVVIHTPHAMAFAEEWIASSDPLLKRGGWSTVASLATFGPADLPNAWFERLLPTIERDIHTAPNRVKEAMNTALIAIGSRSEVLRAPATAAAAHIGKVHVDHGETFCKTPDAVSYIAKAHSRRAARSTA